MATSLLTALAIGVIAFGAGMTYLMTVTIPAAVLKHAQNNGRFAGLEAEESHGGSGKAISTGHRNVGKQSFNVC
jgi:hypothetical protein